MKTGINDKVLDRMVSLQGKTSNKIAEYTKGTKPFAKKPLSDDEVLWAIKNSSEQDRIMLSAEYGIEAVNKLLYKAIMTENRRNRNG